MLEVIGPYVQELIAGLSSHGALVLVEVGGSSGTFAVPVGAVELDRQVLVGNDDVEFMVARQDGLIGGEHRLGAGERSDDLGQFELCVAGSAVRAPRASGGALACAVVEMCGVDVLGVVRTHPLQHRIGTCGDGECFARVCQLRGQARMGGGKV